MYFFNRFDKYFSIFSLFLSKPYKILLKKDRFPIVQKPPTCYNRGNATIHADLAENYKRKGM